MPIRRQPASLDDPFGYGTDNTGVSGYGFPTGTDTPGYTTGIPGGTNSVPKDPSGGGGNTAQPYSTKYLGAIDTSKLNSATFHDPKYDIARIWSANDPSKGFTPDIVKQINALGYGSGHGSGSDWTWDSLTDAGKKAGLVAGQTGDYIGGFDTSNPHWQWWYPGIWDNAGASGAGSIAAGNAAALGLPGGSAGASSSAGGSASGSQPASEASLRAVLAGLFPGGLFNQDIVNRRTESAREDLLRQRRSQQANDQAYLADRGLIGSGPEATANSLLNQSIDNSYQNAVSDIYSNESQNADARMMQALSLATGMSEADAQNLISWYQAQTSRAGVNGSLANDRARIANDFTLGQGNLALGNMNGINSYNLGLANYGLSRDQLQWQEQNAGIDQLIALINQLQSGAKTAGTGYL